MTVASLNVKIGADASELKRVFKDVQRATEPMARKLRSIGSSMTQFVTLPIVAAGAGALKASADFEKLEMGMAALMGSSEAASAELSKLREIAKMPGLGFEQAVKGSLNLQAVGFSADMARETLEQFGNALALSGGSSQDLSEVIRQLSQVQSLGKVTAENMNVLRERVPLVNKAMQEAFGTTSIERIRESGMATEDFIKQLTEGLGELERAQGGLANAFVNAMMAVKNFGRAIGDRLNTLFNVQELVEGVSAGLDSLAGQFLALSDSTQKAIFAVAGIAAALGPLLAALGTLGIALTAIATGFAALTSPIALVIGGIAALAGTVYLVYQNWGGITDYFAQLWSGVSSIFESAAGLLGAIIKRMWLTIKSFVIGGIRDAILLPIKSLANFLGAGALADSIANAGSALGSLIPQGALSENAARINALKSGMVGGLVDIATASSRIGGNIGESIEKMVEDAKKAMDAFTGDSKEPGTGGGGGSKTSSPLRIGLESVAKIATEVQMKLAGITSEVRNATAAWERYMQRVSEVGSITQAAIDGVRDAVLGISDALGRAITEATSLGDAFKSFGKMAGRVIKRVIADMISAVAQTIIWRALLTAFSGGAGGIIGSVVRSAAPDDLSAFSVAAPSAGINPASAAGLSMSSNMSRGLHVTVGGEARVENRTMLIGIREALEEERQAGRGDGTL